MAKRLLEHIRSMRRMRSAGNDRATGGFTMAELIAAVAILVVLMGVAFVSLFNIRDAFIQLELDTTAREIYYAAQNHLITAEADGDLRKYKKADATGKGTQDPDAEDDVYYLVAPSPNSPNDPILSVMLPPFSIDETIRAGGSYVIRYQLSSAKVLDVFYAETRPSGFASHGYLPSGFSTGDYASLTTTYIDGNGADAHLNRRHFVSSSGEQGIIGYYGGEGTEEPINDVAPPIIEIDNSDRLVVKVKNPKSNVDTLGSDDILLKLYVTGKTSDAKACFNLAPQANKSAYTFDSTSDEKYYNYLAILDDVTGDGTTTDRFFNVMSAIQQGQGASTGEFIAGEDLELYAEVTSNSKLAMVARSAKYVTNSLFADGTSVPESSDADNSDVTEPGQGGSGASEPGAYKAEIASFRHLENLDANVSSFDPTNFTSSDTVNAQQITDLRWEEFPNNTGVPGDVSVSAATGDARTYFSDEAGKYSGNGNYLPISPGYKYDYDGKAHMIFGVKTDAAEISALGETGSYDIGLFGTLSAGSAVHDLELVDFTVKTANGAAGALAGVVGNKATVSDVLVRDKMEGDEADTSKFNGAVVTGGTGLPQQAEDDGVSKVTGSAAAGGLVGQSVSAEGNAVTIENCAAAVYVNATEGAAGGLVGKASGTLNLSQSYSGGHLPDGAYDVGNMNVISAGAAGGLVGSADRLAAGKCYSTCSVAGAAEVGGLVGSVGAGSIENCYATGFVSGDNEDTLGAFAGSLGNGVATSDDHYIEIINRHEYVKSVEEEEGEETADSDIEPEMPSIGGNVLKDGEGKVIEVEKRQGVDAIDADTATYKAFVPAADEMAKANPYDGTLATLFRHDGDEGDGAAADDPKPKNVNYPYKVIAPKEGESNSASNLGGSLPQPKDEDGEDGEPQSGLDGAGASGGGSGEGSTSAAADMLVDHLTTHYGDWPAPGILVVND